MRFEHVQHVECLRTCGPAHSPAMWALRRPGFQQKSKVVVDVVPYFSKQNNSGNYTHTYIYIYTRGLPRRVLGHIDGAILTGVNCSTSGRQNANIHVHLPAALRYTPPCRFTVHDNMITPMPDPLCQPRHPQQPCAASVLFQPSQTPSTTRVRNKMPTKNVKQLYYYVLLPKNKTTRKKSSCTNKKKTKRQNTHTHTKHTA